MMKYIVLACCLALAPGCALFSGDPAASADAIVTPAPLARTPAAVESRETRAAFRPAFAAGRPVALIPCRENVSLAADCATRNERHQVTEVTPVE